MVNKDICGGPSRKHEEREFPRLLYSFTSRQPHPSLSYLVHTQRNILPASSTKVRETAAIMVAITIANVWAVLLVTGAVRAGLGSPMPTAAPTQPGELEARQINLPSVPLNTVWYCTDANGKGCCRAQQSIVGRCGMPECCYCHLHRLALCTLTIKTQADLAFAR